MAIKIFQHLVKRNKLFLNVFAKKTKKNTAWIEIYSVPKIRNFDTFGNKNGFKENTVRKEN